MPLLNPLQGEDFKNRALKNPCNLRRFPYIKVKEK
jgi:hypothetical protein